MTDPLNALQRERIDAVLALAATRQQAPEQGAMIESFGREYFRRVDAEDLLARTPEDLLGALLSHLQFGAKRQPGQTLARVLSPSVADNGWASRHSVIDIINDDMPFLVDTTTIEINRQGLTLHLIVHPIFGVERDADGQLLSIRPRSEAVDAPGLKRESWMHIEVDRIIDAQQRHELLAGIERVLGDVRAAVQDWQPMVGALRATIKELEQAPAALDKAEVQESLAFLQWLADDHMTLLGYRCHELVTEAGADALRLVSGSGLGLLRETSEEKLSSSFSMLPANARALARAPSPLLVITKANTRSTVHRAGYTDYVGVKRYDSSGQVTGEHRFIGLFTSTAYSARVSETPLLRGRVDAITQRAGLPAGGHLAKALQHILETYPRDDLYQISNDELYETALGILALGERQRLRLFVCRDPFDRFFSCLVYVPREAYSTDMRIKFQAILMQVFSGSSAEFDVQLSDAVLARIHFTVRTTPGQVPVFDRKEVEARLTAAARRWDDDLRDALVDAEGEARGLELFKRWGAGFPAGYRERVSARAAVPDVVKLASLSPEAPLALALYRPFGAESGTLGFKVYRSGQAVVLSDSLPMLEHMGVRVLGEHNHRILDAAGQNSSVSLHDFELQASVSDEIEPEALARLFEDTFARVFRGEVENDDFNRLVLRAGLANDEIVVLRAYAKYLRQIGFALSQATIEATLAAHPRIARMLVTLFKLRFDPAAHDELGANAQVNGIEKALEKVSNLQEDRVLRQLLALIQATLRTNFWRTGIGHTGAAGPRRSFLSFKLDSAKIPGLPEPRPLYEISVYSPRFEGIHLRGGKVARGGLRWSDRPEDFRTEVLGLVKAQMVKNTVIVPVGSKGGFVLKKAPPQSDREAFMKEGISCYQDYLRALLDLTDNYAAGLVVAPPQVVRLDEDDPYLVVAADKGTATFSDYANAVSLEYGHWLGDAFASGGSVGYDHKAMGITARGAWESVKRHFREIGVNTQNEEFTVVGVGDMSGDVFGNGMLLSPHIRLVAAFDHRHVFIDPSPDAASSFAERERLFKLPRSSWADYEASLISAGGGIWARSEKSIPISPQAQAVLGITAERLAPNELLSAILKAPVDLLYNGGIGTYIKSASETHADVGDRANDALRINGADLRCKVVGEGGNLGCTQRGRVEAALAGVRIYTDAIDNSAGVDTSDHEVNIKILLGLAMGDGEMTLKQRNVLLPQMTDEVASLVLRDNYFQTQALSIASRQGAALIDQQARFIRFLERAGRLNRAIEFLPTDDQIKERKARGIGLTTPEMAVLLAYSKMWLSDELMSSDLPEDSWIGTAVERYFPALLREKFASYIPRHPLKREIIVTHVLNSMLNRVGATFVHRLSESSGAKPAQIVRAYLATREVFGYVPLWLKIEALDNLVPDEVQADMIDELGRLGAHATNWFLRSRRLAEPMEQVIKRFAPAVEVLRTTLVQHNDLSARAAARVEAGVPIDIARDVSHAEELFAALDIAEIADATQHSLEVVCEVHAKLGQKLGLERLRQQIDALAADSYWQTQAKAALGDDLSGLQRAIALDVLGQGGAQSAPELLSNWATRNQDALERAHKLLGEFSEAKAVDLAMLSVALRELRNLA
ncbi:NAD-glutamate dehydrogenase [Paucibacter sp. B2R-40]|uniref:NAD-glutamate dehydrogenase n=1 Tax=Paucibacter sp. B2R-40 TaxID=2893554 RepID=UPI0021E36E63|nr:NAD-glutamate dehydrogenase [Paucibacter sp. B2R-40]MCV2353971.1 NAD-glutamate dehydrogenase [Paucibacter sp. B2R-40]